MNTFQNTTKGCYYNLLYISQALISTTAMLFLKKSLSDTYRADCRLAPSQWETALQSNAVSHWLDANLDSALTWMFAVSQPPAPIHHLSHNTSSILLRWSAPFFSGLFHLPISISLSSPTQQIWPFFPQSHGWPISVIWAPNICATCQGWKSKGTSYHGIHGPLGPGLHAI